MEAGFEEGIDDEVMDDCYEAMLKVLQNKRERNYFKLYSAKE